MATEGSKHPFLSAFFCLLDEKQLFFRCYHFPVFLKEASPAVAIGGVANFFSFDTTVYEGKGASDIPRMLKRYFEVLYENSMAESGTLLQERLKIDWVKGDQGVFYRSFLAGFGESQMILPQSQR